MVLYSPAPESKSDSPAHQKPCFCMDGRSSLIKSWNEWRFLAVPNMTAQEGLKRQSGCINRKDSYPQSTKQCLEGSTGQLISLEAAEICLSSCVTHTRETFDGRHTRQHPPGCCTRVHTTDTHCHEQHNWKENSYPPRTGQATTRPHRWFYLWTVHSQLQPLLCWLAPLQICLHHFPRSLSP